MTWLMLMDFYPRSPRGERPKLISRLSKVRNFYPRSPRGERHPPVRRWYLHLCYFYPRSPRGERRLDAWHYADYYKISIHAPREGSDVFWLIVPVPEPQISIHAPREGSDGRQGGCFQRVMPISIHAPREGSDHCGREVRPLAGLFLSTLPARGATKPAARKKPAAKFLSTLPARGATVHGLGLLGRVRISIHAPREGSDLRLFCALSSAVDFYPRSPRGERHMIRASVRAAGFISIHAPREGSDSKCAEK